MLLMLMINSVSAEYLQILHTNDLHSYFDHTIIDPTRGSYAALKVIWEHVDKTWT